MEQIFNYLIVLLGLFGFFVAYYIGHHKHNKKKLVCPIDSNCEVVIHSHYSTILGIPLEALGMLYYLTISFGYVSIAFLPVFNVPEIILLLTTLTVIAFFLSLYLFFIQAFRIKEWCAWCLVSAGLSTAIFIIVIATSSHTIPELVDVIIK